MKYNVLFLTISYLLSNNTAIATTINEEKNVVPKKEDLRHVEQAISLKNALDGYNEIVNSCLLSFPEAQVLQHSLELLQADIEQRFSEVLKAVCSQ